jgi:hypothetical protein
LTNIFIFTIHFHSFFSFFHPPFFNFSSSFLYFLRVLCISCMKRQVSGLFTRGRASVAAKEDGISSPLGRKSVAVTGAERSPNGAGLGGGGGGGLKRNQTFTNMHSAAAKAKPRPPFQARRFSDKGEAEDEVELKQIGETRGSVSHL